MIQFFERRLEEDTSFFMPNKFYKIPVTVFESKLLTLADKHVYTFIASFDDECFMSKEKIAEKTGLSLRQVKRSIKFLCEIGLLTKNPNHGHHSSYTAIEPPTKNLDIS